MENDRIQPALGCQGLPRRRPTTAGLLETRGLLRWADLLVPPGPGGPLTPWPPLPPGPCLLGVGTEQTLTGNGLGGCLWYQTSPSSMTPARKVALRVMRRHPQSLV